MNTNGHEFLFEGLNGGAPKPWRRSAMEDIRAYAVADPRGFQEEHRRTVGTVTPLEAMGQEILRLESDRGR